ncbi:MAG: Dna2/Cas4 domain-containing protein [Thermosphaera sp.]
MPYQPEQSVSPSMVKDFIYCPIIAWIRLKYNVAEPATDSMKEGRNVKVSDGKGQLKLSSNGMVTLVDEIVKRGKHLMIIERKKFPTRSLHRYMAQLAVTSYIASRRIKGLRTMALEIAGSLRELELSGDAMDGAKEHFRRVKVQEARDRPPPTIPEPSRCKWCWYRRFCPYG